VYAFFEDTPPEYDLPLHAGKCMLVVRESSIVTLTAMYSACVQRMLDPACEGAFDVVAGVGVLPCKLQVWLMCAATDADVIDRVKAMLNRTFAGVRGMGRSPAAPWSVKAHPPAPVAVPPQQVQALRHASSVIAGALRNMRHPFLETVKPILDMVCEQGSWGSATYAISDAQYCKITLKAYERYNQTAAAVNQVYSVMRPLANQGVITHTQRRIMEATMNDAMEEVLNWTYHALSAKDQSGRSVDLHGYNTLLGRHHVLKKLDTAVGVQEFIPGRGKHSVGNKPVLRPMVREILENHPKFRVIETSNPGVVRYTTVDGDGSSSPSSSSPASSVSSELASLSFSDDSADSTTDAGCTSS